MLILENINHEDFKKYIKELYNYAIERLKIDRAPVIVLKKDKKNADDIFGKTGYYDPDRETIALFITNRHPKDILRSFAHELVHHEQKCRGDNEKVDLSLTAKDPAYAMHDDDLRNMEREAFEVGNLIFRDWCDTKKIERENTMSESKEMIDAVLKRVTERLIAESKDGFKRQANKAKTKPKPEKPRSEEEEDLKNLKKYSSGVKKEAKMPMKVDKEDADNDGDTSEEVPAFLDKGDVKKKKKGGKVPKQLEKFVKEKAKKDAKEQMSHKTGADEERLQKESKSAGDNVLPHAKLFEKKERLFNERFSKHEELIFQELLKRAIK